MEEALDRKTDPMQIVEEAMMPAMRAVGERYKNEDANILRILAAARCVRKGFELIEKQDEAFSCKSIGTVILGTVEGDLHDVGKNLVALMFRSAGFKVIDLGVDVSEKQFLWSVAKNPEGNYKIMVGGGAVTRQLAEHMGADAYTENCVEAAEVAKTFIV